MSQCTSGGSIDYVLQIESGVSWWNEQTDICSNVFQGFSVCEQQILVKYLWPHGGSVIMIQNKRKNIYFCRVAGLIKIDYTRVIKRTTSYVKYNVCSKTTKLFNSTWLSSFVLSEEGSIIIL